jgi:hypothetical protein
MDVPRPGGRVTETLGLRSWSMWIVDLWSFEHGEAVHKASSEAEDRQAAWDEATSALQGDPMLGATIYDQDSGGGFPVPKAGDVVVQQS